MLGRLVGALGRRFRAGPAAAAPSAAEWIERGIASNRAGDLADAAICFERALALDPDAVPALHGRAAMHHLAGDHEDAIALCDDVIARAPRHLDAWITRGFAARALGRLDEALTAFRTAVDIDARPGLISCVGGILFQQGRIAAALEQMDRALAADPAADLIHSNRLFILNHDPRLTPAQVAAAHFAWGRMVEARLAPLREPLAPDPDPARRLRVGYVSADLRTHSVAFYLAPVLEHHDRTRVEVICYDNQPGPGDAFTRRLERLADQWVRTAALDDLALARRIRADRVDVLVDLSGHTGGNRLPVFAMRAAPVQVSWFGYMNTTGLTAMDYRLTDPSLLPPGAEALYSEALFRIPSTAVWSPAPDSPEPGPLPALAHGQVRFGSFNNWAKVSDDVVRTWSALLGRVPEARLLVVAAGGDDEGARAQIAARFGRAGVGRERLEIVGTRPLAQFLDLVRSVDIALDPYPYNGGTTTMHTLWMGVPVVSLAMEQEIGRVSRGLLWACGLHDLCASSEDRYVDAAAALAHDLPRLAALRQDLRTRLRASPLMNGAEMATNLEKAFRVMWHNHLQGDKHRLSI
ncbi:MAG: tetratricopeptide repeat protein [Burkholderiales bacterium]|nr:tetratricopeptide repeat protein [Burkholderiales bacterium]